MYKSCIFDLDGTIIDTIQSMTHSISLTMGNFGYAPVDEAHTRKFVGDGYRKLVERALLHSGDKELVHYEEALSVYKKTFRENCLYKVKAYDGMPEFLSYLKEKGIKIGVLTNKGHERAVECVEAVYGKHYFDQIIGEGNGIKVKPDPAGALLMADRFSLPPAACLYFGDTNTDMKTGRNAGMDTVGVTWGFRDRQELEALNPKYIISHPSEIRHVFE